MHRRVAVLVDRVHVAAQVERDIHGFEGLLFGARIFAGEYTPRPAAAISGVVPSSLVSSGSAEVREQAHQRSVAVRAAMRNGVAATMLDAVAYL